MALTVVVARGNLQGLDLPTEDKHHPECKDLCAGSALAALLCLKRKLLTGHDLTNFAVGRGLPNQDTKSTVKKNVDGNPISSG